MNRFLSFCAFMLAAVAAAGLFGAVHDQITYSVSPEYYTRFKFLQFRLLDPAVPERIRAAQVGFLASWWMGIPMGLLSGGVGVFLHQHAGQARRALFLSLPVIAAFTLAAALCGLAYGYTRTEHIDPAAYRRWFIPRDLEDLRAFLCAGYMHNAAYLGGLLAIPASWAFHVVCRLRSDRSPATGRPADAAAN